MPTFPTLSRKPTIAGYGNTIAHDPTLRVETSDGYVATRAQFTRLVGEWPVDYTSLTGTDKSTLDSFQASVGVGSASFDWTEPITSTVYVVRFAEKVVWQRQSLKWACSFKLEEV